jgi:peptide/nickel transport system substrate-binding protein
VQDRRGASSFHVPSLRAIGIRTRLRLMERAAYYKEYADKKLRGILLTGSGAPGNAATRLDVYAVTGGPYVYHTYPEIDGLFSEQVNEQNPRARTQILRKAQQILHERVMFGPVLEPAFLNGVGPRVLNSGLGVIANFPYSAPYEDLALKAK